MKSNELRLGNWVKELDGNTMQIEYISDIHHAANLEPIPLTEEWLIKFGFEWDKSQKDYYINIEEDNQICINLKEQVFYIGCGFEWGAVKGKSKYVHQLQNLYFALTGEELKYEDTTPE